MCDYYVVIMMWRCVYVVKVVCDYVVEVCVIM